jgi:hypothetical protein
MILSPENSVSADEHTHRQSQFAAAELSKASSSLHIGSRIVAAILSHKLVTSAYSTHDVADTYSVAMSLAQAATSVDLVLLAPASAAADPTTYSESNTPASLSEMRRHYESQLSERAASPLHRVSTLSDHRSADIAAEASVVSYLQLDSNDRLDGNSATVEGSQLQEVRVRLHGSGSDVLVHPLVSHCLAVDVAADLLVVDRVFCRSLGLLRGENLANENEKARRSEAR